MSFHKACLASLLRLLGQLRRVGIRITPCFLFREGVRPHRADWPELAREFPSSVLRAGDAADVEAIARFEAWRTEGRVRARLAKGDLCVMLKHRGRIAGFTWADFDAISDVACDQPLKPGEAYLYDAVIAPEHRGRGLAAYLRAESYRQLRGSGHLAFYSVSDCSNTPAIRFKQRLNADITRLYVQIKVGKRLLGNWLLRDYARSAASRRARSA